LASRRASTADENLISGFRISPPSRRGLDAERAAPGGRRPTGRGSWRTLLLIHAPPYPTTFKEFCRVAHHGKLVPMSEMGPIRDRIGRWRDVRSSPVSVRTTDIVGGPCQERTHALLIAGPPPAQPKLLRRRRFGQDARHFPAARRLHRSPTVTIPAIVPRAVV
jgi:hypothetical protein